MVSHKMRVLSDQITIESLMTPARSSKPAEVGLVIVLRILLCCGNAVDSLDGILSQDSPNFGMRYYLSHHDG